MIYGLNLSGTLWGFVENTKIFAPLWGRGSSVLKEWIKRTMVLKAHSCWCSSKQTTSPWSTHACVCFLKPNVLLTFFFTFTLFTFFLSLHVCLTSIYDPILHCHIRSTLCESAAPTPHPHPINPLGKTHLDNYLPFRLIPLLGRIPSHSSLPTLHPFGRACQTNFKKRPPRQSRVAQGGFALLRITIKDHRGSDADSHGFH